MERDLKGNVAGKHVDVEHSAEAYCLAVTAQLGLARLSLAQLKAAQPKLGRAQSSCCRLRNVLLYQITQAIAIISLAYRQSKLRTSFGYLIATSALGNCISFRPVSTDFISCQVPPSGPFLPHAVPPSSIDAQAQHPGPEVLGL